MLLRINKLRNTQHLAVRLAEVGKWISLVKNTAIIIVKILFRNNSLLSAGQVLTQ